MHSDHDDTLRVAARRKDVKLEEISRKRRSLQRFQESLETETDYLYQLDNQVHMAIDRLSCLADDEEWKRQGYIDTQEYYCAKQESQHAISLEYEKIEEEKRTLSKEEDDCLKAYEKVRVQEVTIRDAQNLSYYEKCAILACITSNPDLYSYAAENQFHADVFFKAEVALQVSDQLSNARVAPIQDMANSLLNSLAQSVSGRIQPHAIVSSAGVVSTVGTTTMVSEPFFKTSFLRRANVSVNGLSMPSNADYLPGASYYDQQERTHSTPDTPGLIFP